MRSPGLWRSRLWQCGEGSRTPEEIDKHVQRTFPIIKHFSSHLILTTSPRRCMVESPLQSQGGRLGKASACLHSDHAQALCLQAVWAEPEATGFHYPRLRNEGCTSSSSPDVWWTTQVQVLLVACASSSMKWEAVTSTICHPAL